MKGVNKSVINGSFYAIQKMITFSFNLNNQIKNKAQTINYNKITHAQTRKYRKLEYFRPRLIFVHARAYENKTNRNFSS